MTNPNVKTKPAPALPALARMAGEDDPFTVLGAVVPKGAPMRALLKLADDHRALVTALQALLHPLHAKHQEADAYALLHSLGEIE